MRAYYNEFDRQAAAWLRELIAAGLIAPGDVDERSICEVSPSDLKGYGQCHFFAGIGGWSYALRLAGVSDGVPIWTGSCPCQPFSAAGKRGGNQDARHLWPAFARLIEFCRPAVVFGEQVASKDGRGWLTGVFADLEGMGYLRAGTDLCAASVGAPHIRQRLYWVGVSAEGGWRSWRAGAEVSGQGSCGEAERSGFAGGVADADEGERGRVADGEGCERDGDASGREQGDGESESGGAVGGVDHDKRIGRRAIGDDHCGNERQFFTADGGAGGVGVSDCAGSLEGKPATTSARYRRSAVAAGGADCWGRFDLVPCADGKARRVESGTFPLADGVPGRVGLLRGYGNAIVPQVAAVFVEEVLASLSA